MKLTALNCPNCGAPYDPGKMQCEYCGSYIIMSNENYVDLSQNKFDLKQINEDKYPGIYVYGRLLGKGEKPLLVGEANLMSGLASAGGKLLLTNKSLSFSAHMLNIGKKSAVIDLNDVIEAKLAANLVVSQHITVRTNKESYRFVVCHGQEWVDKINQAVNDIKNGSGAGGWGTAPGEKSDYADELRKLHKLLDEGLITEDEYNIKKRQILNI